MAVLFRKRRQRHRVCRCLRMLLLLPVLAGLLLLMMIRCRPVLTAFAESEAVWIANKIANETVAEILQQEAELCRSMIHVSYNDRQLLSAVVTDTTAVNTVKTAATAAVIRKMEGLSSISVDIPFGTLAGFDWLSGWGPLVRFPMSVTSTVLSTVSSSLEAAGMNQTTYRVMVHMDISLYVVTPGGRSSVAAESSYPMAEAVLLGEVPDNLTEVYGDDQTLLGKIFDYGTGE